MISKAAISLRNTRSLLASSPALCRFSSDNALKTSERPDANMLDGSNRDKDELFQDDEIVKAIRIDRD